ncbi:MAG TPA: toll/interleukin-1 receptor domain-containing protein [Thermoanaerobaculia bacterium]|nr:toll/interleukin-1 receptor domain-containing protein [Thermoanaerobaculia bacterium]
MTARPLNVFVSYAQESPEHAERVRRLVEQLRAQGFRCSYDQDPAWREEGWLEWMKHEIEKSHVVLMVCSSQYAKVEGGAGQPVRGRGSRFEYTLLRDEVFSAGMRNKRIVPILLGGVSEEVIPAEFRDYTYFRPDSEAGFGRLVEHLRLPRCGALGPGRPSASRWQSRSRAPRRAVAVGAALLGVFLLIVMIQRWPADTARIEPPTHETEVQTPATAPPNFPGASQPIEERPKPHVEDRKPRPAPLHAEFRLGDGQARTFLGGRVTISVVYHQLGSRTYGTLYLNVHGQEPRKEPLAHAGPLLFELNGNQYSLTVLEDNEATRSASLELNELR